MPKLLNDIGRCYAKIPQRWIVAFMCFLALFNAYAMRSCLSIAITEMTEPVVKIQNSNDTTCPSPDNPDAKPIDNSTININNTIPSEQNSGNKYKWNEEIQGMILSSFYGGYVITHLPGGLMAEKYGGKHTLGVGIFLTGVFTILTPYVTYIGGHVGLIILRVLMGLGEGTTYPAINVLLAQWTPPEERSRTASFVYSGALIGIVFSTSVSGWILKNTLMGWPLVFYSMGGVSIIWFLIWLVTCYSTPRDHPFISRKEAEYLKDRLNEHTHEKPPPAPWSHILKSKPLWAVIIALIGFNWSILTILTDLPKYMSGVLKLSVDKNGYFSSLVYIFMWVGGNTSPWLADYLISSGKVSTTRVRKFFSITALLCSSIFVISASYAGCDYMRVVWLLMIALTFLGTAFPGVMVNPLDLSPNYAGTLMAMTNGISALSGFVSPYIVGVLTPNQTLNEWRIVFWILVGIAVFSNLVYLIWGSGEVEYWNDPEFVQNQIDERKRKNNKTSTVS